MISFVRGQLVSASLTHAVVDVGGVGYEVRIPATVVGRLPEPGKPVMLHTVAVYREDDAALYGFPTIEERDFFRLVIEKVQQVGPRVALALLGSLTVADVRASILAGDVASLSKAKGIGRKIAERIVLDLKDVVGSVALPAGQVAPIPALPGVPAGALQDAVLALIALGYRPADAEAAARKAQAALGPHASSDALTRAALGAR
jgi:Holliday junction DNA helicase RuvA